MSVLTYCAGGWLAVRHLVDNELCGKYHGETELLIKIPSAKDSLELCLTHVSTVSTGVLRGNNGPQHLLYDVTEVTAQTLEEPCRLDLGKEKRGHQH